MPYIIGLHCLKPQKMIADSAVVYADDGVTPLVVIVAADGAYMISKAGDPDFEVALRNLGITQSTVVTTYAPEALNQ